MLALEEEAGVDSASKTRFRRASTSGAVLIELAFAGLLLAGALATVKATRMENPTDVVLCLLGALSGCGLLCYVYFLRD
jgi:CHASE2 domain-containing sensor protein